MTEQWRCAGHAGDLSEDAPLEFKLDARRSASTRWAMRCTRWKTSAPTRTRC